MSYRNALGAVVAVLREQAGLTQKDLQARTPLPQWRFSKLERGQGSSDQRMATLAALAPLVGQDVAQVVELAARVAAAAGGVDPDHGEAVRLARLAVSGELSDAPEPDPVTPWSYEVDPLAERIELRLAQALDGTLSLDQAGRTVAQLANALENYERAMYLREQRAALRNEQQ